MPAGPAAEAEQPAAITRVIPQSDDGAILYLQEPGSSVGKRSEHLVVRKDGKELHRVPMHAVRQVVVFGNVQVSTQALETLAANDIPVAYLTGHGRFVQDMLLWSTAEFGYLRLGDGYVQGSSIMPQKRNPVALEHARAIGSKALGQAQAIDERIGKLVNVRAPTQEQEALLNNLKRQASELRRQMLELALLLAPAEGTASRCRHVALPHPAEPRG